MQLGIEKRMVPHIPWGLLLTTLAIALLGIWNLASAARPPHTVWSAQAIYLGVAALAALLVSLVDYRWIQRMSWPIYLLNIAALLALRVIGHKAKGAESWIVLGPVRLQPSEFMKIGMILMLAKFYHEDYRPTDDSYGFLRLLKPLALVLIPIGLVAAHPDLGSAMMMLFTAVTVILFGRVRWHLVALLGVGLLAVSVVIWNDYVRETPQPHATILRHFLKPHQSNRISGWLSPESDLRGSNYHSAQSKIAVGSGGMFGKGWREGTQTALSFLPEQHTDFIFSVWAEEHGFVMCVLLLALYGLLLLFSLGVAFNARERFGAFVAVGVACALFWQVFENIGMVSGLLPVTGITLPLMSYGGSSLVSVMMMLGLLMNVSMRRHMF